MNSDPEIRSDNGNSSRSVRGPQFPALSLREAVQKVRVIWDHEKRNSASFDILAKHWNYSPKSSSARGCVAALSRYGLIESIGSEYRLTNRTLSILLAEDVEKHDSLRAAALSPKCFSDLWNKYGVDLPSDQSLSHKLIMEGYNASTVGSLIKDWKDTIDFANLKKEDAHDSELFEDKGEEALSLFRNDTSRSVPVQSSTLASAKPVQTGQAPASPPGNPSIRYLPIPLEIGDAQIPMGMTKNDFELLLESLKLWEKRIVASEVIEKAPDEAVSPSLNVEDY